MTDLAFIESFISTLSTTPRTFPSVTSPISLAHLSAEPTPIQLKIKPMKGHDPFQLEIPQTTSIRNLKVFIIQKIYKKEKEDILGEVEVEKVGKLLWNGKVLSDLKRICDYDIPEGTSLTWMQLQTPFTDNTAKEEKKQDQIKSYIEPVKQESSKAKEMEIKEWEKHQFWVELKQFLNQKLTNKHQVDIILEKFKKTLLQ